MPSGQGSEVIADPSSLYRGEAGGRYHERRASARSADDQRGRARYFEGVATEADTVLDFGCGTGGILSALPAARRIGVEINERAAAVARNNLDQVVPSLDELPEASADVAISFHAIEHVADPFAVLRKLHRIVRPGGSVRFIVPYEGVFLNRQHRAWRADDPDMHLYGWSPLTFGNLIAQCGFEVTDARLCPMSSGGRLAQLFKGVPPVVNALVWLKALRGGRLQVVVTARRP